MLITKKKFHKELPVLLILLGISFIYGLFFSSSTWHNYICPYSILLKGGGKLSLFSYRVDESGCIGCKKCVKECPVNAINFDEVTKKAHINTSLCHQCGHCSSVCPTQAISYRKR
jgi:NAD-dependent dihydropyrimidine dehydrogenase PreA subunit